LKQRVVVVGAGGQLGRELLRTAGPQTQCHSLDRAQLDIGDPVAVAATLASLQPQLVINAAAYTGVDTAESEPAAAFRVNAEGPRNIARWCAQQSVRLLHVSTDFVFSGESSRPYTPDAATGPLGEYGRSKLAGENAVREELPTALILRTAWVYSRFGNNFVKTMLRLMSERTSLSVVADQTGTPTWARGLAEALWAAAQRPQLCGIYHWTDAGVCSWYDFAVAIAEEATTRGLLEAPARVQPIPASAYPTPARRPSYSVLDKSSSWQDLELEAVHWRVQLRAMLDDVKESPNE